MVPGLRVLQQLRPAPGSVPSHQIQKGGECQQAGGAGQAQGPAGFDQNLGRGFQAAPLYLGGQGFQFLPLGRGQGRLMQAEGIGPALLPGQGRRGIRLVAAGRAVIRDPVGVYLALQAHR
mgnify:CR=1 FL=1